MSSWYFTQESLRDYVVNTLPKYMQDIFNDDELSLIVKFYGKEIDNKGLIKITIGDDDAD